MLDLWAMIPFNTHVYMIEINKREEPFGTSLLFMVVSEGLEPSTH